MKWVSNLECINCISASFLGNVINLLWSHTILIHTIIKSYLTCKPHRFSWNQIITLLPYTTNFWVVLRMSSKSLSANLFFSIIEKLWLFNNCHYFILPCQRNSALTLKLISLFGSNVLSNWNRENMSITIIISDGVHIHTFDKFLLIHKSSKWECPSFSNCLQII